MSSAMSRMTFGRVSAEAVTDSSRTATTTKPVAHVDAAFGTVFGVLGPCQSDRYIRRSLPMLHSVPVEPSNE